MSPAVKASCLALVGLGLCGVLAHSGNAQSVGLPPGYGSPAPGYGSPAPGYGSPAPAYGSPAMGTASPGFPTAPPPASASLGPGIQPFDPYALPPGAGSAPNPAATGFGAPTLPPAPPTTSWPAPGLTNPTAPYPAPPPSMFGASPYTPAPAAPYGAAPASPFGAAPYGTTPYGATPYGGAAQPIAPPPYQRLFGNTGFRYTWVAGDGEGTNLQTQDLEISTALNCANFFGSAGGLRVTPGFVFTWLDGPSAPVTADLPPVLYSAYVDFGWYPVFSPQLSAEVNFRPGVFSDFDTVTTDSIRLLGSGIGVIKLGPTSSLKLGAIYIDRADVKLLPAFGVLWTPNAQTRWDIFFPSPKLSHYWKTVQNGQMWWYVGAEYGGGSWTMSRPEPPEQGASERVDINDYRVFLGTEWFNLNRMYGFFEVGYVFNRELFYVVVPEDRTSLSDSWMLRAGISF